MTMCYYPENITNYSKVIIINNLYITNFCKYITNYNKYIINVKSCY